MGGKQTDSEQDRVEQGTEWLLSAISFKQVLRVTAHVVIVNGDRLPCPGSLEVPLK